MIWKNAVHIRQVQIINIWIKNSFLLFNIWDMEKGFLRCFLSSDQANPFAYSYTHHVTVACLDRGGGGGGGVGKVVKMLTTNDH